MNEEKKHRLIKLIVTALKIAIGSCLSIYIAESMELKFATAAGTITMLTIVTTKWETLKLSLFRILTLLMSILFCWVLFANIQSDWIAYGLFIFLIVVISDWIGWKSTISVNAVIGSHFLQTHDFSAAFIQNEILIVVLGILLAIIFNLYHNNGSQRRKIVRNMREVEGSLQTILEELRCYLSCKPMKENVWEDIISLEKKLDLYLEQAYEYQNNTFQSHTSYYTQYFEMRMKQCGVLHSLHYELKKIRSLPKQAAVIAEYVNYLRNYIVEVNDPTEQIERLEQIFDEMKREELPKSREEFESRAKLYHILMDLEEFLTFKKRFLEAIDEKQLRIYWKKDEEEFPENII